MLSERNRLNPSEIRALLALLVSFITSSKPEKPRIGQIGNRSWGRTLSNRLGLSWVEAERYSDKPEQLPVQEKLL
ncbi:hypothetical protein, partial [Vibrio aestuarianus]|uniref:hypothetical protein n=1 Tax=Vibrio aestuarianus TaxID=28171 RepID=UPI001C13295D